MFSISKYTTWYYSIIENAKKQDRKKSKDAYFEAHHILPKSLGGTRAKENMVLLTAREHFICHVLLVKMTTGKDKMRMSYAFYSMNMNNQYAKRYVNSKLYELCRYNFAQYMSGSNSHLYGVPKTETQRNKIRQTREAKGYNLPENNGMFGKKHSDFTKDKISRSQKISHIGQIQKHIDANPFKKRITDGTTIYQSVRDASRLIPAHRNVIGRLVREERMWYC